MGECRYCGSRDQVLIEPIALRDLFDVVLEIYKESDEPGSGQTLVEWLKEDWGIFDHERMDVAHAKELLADILDDGEIVRRKFISPNQDAEQSLLKWQDFRRELTSQNRYFPKNVIKLDRLRELLGFLLAPAGDVPERLYRARIQEGADVFALEEMGAPPAHLAMPGRANPVGIAYLYLASDHQTAIAEVRPHAGNVVCVAEVRTSGSLKIADLRKPRKAISPFAVEIARDVALLRNDIPFLDELGAELTRPVLPRSAPVDYLPTQYLCEFIKDCGFDGVMYGSSVGDGVNVAIFDCGRAKVHSVEQYAVTGVRIMLGDSAGRR